MKSKVIIIAGSVLLAMSSCSVVQQTATSLKSDASVRNFTVADLDVSPNRIYYTMEPTKAEQLGGLENVKRSAESKALKENGNSDVLVDPEFIIEQKRGFFRTKVSKITVSGHPAKYKNYRSLEDTVWSNPAFRGLPSIVVRKGADRSDYRFMQALATSAPGQIYDEPAAPRERRNPTGYNRIMFNYSPLFGSSVYNGKSADESSTMNGGSISYTRGIAVSKRLPMFIETGLGWQFNTDKSLDLMRLNIPVAFTYRFGFGQNEQIKISPFTGLNFGINVMTSLSDKYYYSKSERKEAEKNYKSFQMGWLIGANFTFKRFNIQIAYTFDFMPLYKQDASTGYTGFGEYGVMYNIPEPEINTGVLNVGVGFEF